MVCPPSPNKTAERHPKNRSLRRPAWRRNTAASCPRLDGWQHTDSSGSRQIWTITQRGSRTSANSAKSTEIALRENRSLQPSNWRKPTAENYLHRAGCKRTVTTGWRWICKTTQNDSLTFAKSAAVRRDEHLGNGWPRLRAVQRNTKRPKPQSSPWQSLPLLLPLESGDISLVSGDTFGRTPRGQRQHRPTRL